MGRDDPKKSRFLPVLICLGLGAIVALGAMWGFSEETGSDVGNFSLLEMERQLRSELEAKIQSDILDPILGRGKAMVFVSLELDVESRRQKVVQSGAGYTSKNEVESAGPAETEYVLPGIPKPKNLTEGLTGGKSQQAKQERGAVEEKFTKKTVIKRLEIIIMHEEALARESLEMARARIMDALKQYDVKPEQIVFKPTRMQGRILDDLKQSAVYVPILFVLMLFLFLMFLFGPMASFMRSYVRTIEKREGTEVSVDSEFKGSPQEGQGGGFGGGALGSIEGETEVFGRGGKGGEEETGKFKPFMYINDQNFKGLIFLLKREEPWIISIVLTYIKPEFAQKILASLSLEAQARVAIETAVIREMTREQVMAIDQQIKERVDFVVGGIDPLLKMLDDYRDDIRDSILEYLKNERPEIFEKIRKRLLLFEDIPSIPDKILALVARELKPSDIATALKGAPPEIESKIFANISSGAVNLVKEEIELSAELTVETVANARRKIIGIIKRLEAEGKIVFREKPEVTAIEGIEEDQVKAAERLREWREQSLGAISGLQTSQGSAIGSAGASMPARAALPVEDSATFYEQGLDLYNHGRYGEAAEAFEGAVAGRADFWQAHQGLGSCHYAEGRISKALECYERALEINPTPELEEFVKSVRVQVGA